MLKIVGATVASCAALFLALVYISRGDLLLRSSSHERTPCVDLESCRPLVRVYLGWISLFAAFIFNQSYCAFYGMMMVKGEGSKKKKKKKDESADDGGKGGGGGGGRSSLRHAVKYGTAGYSYGVLCGNRTVGNTLEQTPIFLLAVALHAVTVDVHSAAQLGWLWLLFRAIYPFVFPRGAPILYLSTFSGYGLIFLLLLPVWQQAMPTTTQ